MPKATRVTENLSPTVHTLLCMAGCVWGQKKKNTDWPEAKKARSSVRGKKNLPIFFRP